jgi:S1-C subfamily serine protease
MRRHHAPLIAAGLAVALSGSSAFAGPGDTNTPDRDETFQSFTVTSRARLGVMVIQLTPELRTHFGASKDRGVLVGRIEPGSAAAAAGLAVGDIVTEVRGDIIEDARDMIAALAPANKDEKVTIAVVRDKQPVTLTATMRDAPSPLPSRMLDRRSSQRWPEWFRDFFDVAPRAPSKST